AVLYRKARDAEALEYLFRAAERLPPDHFGRGRILDTLGMVYSTMGNFPTGIALFRRALEVKEKHRDLLGQALTHGQLGRLLMDWGQVDQAEIEFHKDMKLCQLTNDSHGEAQM